MDKLQKEDKNGSYESDSVDEVEFTIEDSRVGDN